MPIAKPGLALTYRTGVNKGPGFWFAVFLSLLSYFTAVIAFWDRLPRSGKFAHLLRGPGSGFLSQRPARRSTHSPGLGSSFALGSKGFGGSFVLAWQANFADHSGICGTPTPTSTSLSSLVAAVGKVHLFSGHRPQLKARQDRTAHLFSNLADKSVVDADGVYCSGCSSKRSGSYIDIRAGRPGYTRRRARHHKGPLLAASPVDNTPPTLLRHLGEVHFDPVPQAPPKRPRSWALKAQRGRGRGAHAPHHHLHVRPSAAGL